MSFQKYPAYKDSGVEWIGRIPAEWTLSRVGSCFAERRQKVSDTDYPPLSVTKNGIVPQLETAAKTDDNNNRKCVIAGDFVINSRSDRKGSSGVSPQDGSVSLINTVISPSERIHGRFCHHLFRSIAFQEEYYKYGKGIVADLWSTNYNEMKLIYLALPPLPEQQVIASFLDRECGKIDALIAEQERLIALLAEKRQAVISHTVTKGLNPNAPMKDSGIPWIGMVPEKWEVHPLKNVASVQTGIAKGKEVIEQKSVQMPYLRVANVQDGYLDLSEVSKINIDRDQVERYLLQQGDVLMNEGGDFDKLGRGAIWHGEISPCIHQNHVFSVRPKSIMSEWLSSVIGSDYAKFYFMTRSKQSTNLASISSTNLMMLPVIVPSIDDQKNIVNFLENKKSQFENLMNSANSIITLLKERRAALVSAAVTGKIDVRAQSKAVAA